MLIKMNRVIKAYINRDDKFGLQMEMKSSPGKATVDMSLT